MNEKERAYRLTQAIDRLLRGEEPDLADEELTEMLQVAKQRRAAAQDATSLSERYREFVWARVEAHIMRLLEQRRQRPHFTADSSAEEEPGTEGEGLQEDCDGLPFRWRREGEEAERLSEAIDRSLLGEPIWEATDSSLKDLLRLARLRHALGKALVSSAAPYQGRMWAHLRARLAAQAQGRQTGSQARLPLFLLRPKLAAVALAFALLISFLAPLPFTGVGGHPIRQFIDLLRHGL